MGRSSSEARLRELCRLGVRRFNFPVLNPELIELALSLLTLSEYSGGGSCDILAEERVVMGLLFSVGVDDGVISVLEEISTSSASRYHFLLRVYLPHPSRPRRPFFHYGGG